MPDESPGTTTKLVFRVILWAVSAFGFTAFLLMLLCPRFNTRMEEWTTQVQTVPAHIQHCDLTRNGDARQNEVRCVYAYTFQGEPYTGASAAYFSDSPFTTSGDLARALAAQRSAAERRAHVHRYAPDHAELVDERWIAAPPLWFILALIFVGCVATYIVLIPSTLRREDMVVQRSGAGSSARDELVEAPGRWTQGRSHRLYQTLALSCAALLCLYGLTNRPAHAVHSAALTGLQPVPAHLTGCTHRWHGMNKGHDDIRCSFEYAFSGKAYTGQAESMDFRLFPTNARMDAQVNKVMQDPDRIAYVDPQHPTYAWAFIDNAWIAPCSWGIFEGLLAIVLLLVLPRLLKETWFPKK